MSNLDPRGHVVPDPTGESPERASFDRLSMSIKDFIVVADQTERGARIEKLTALGNGPSASNPILFWRVNAFDGCQLESTTDGTTFHTIAQSGREPQTLQAVAGWTPFPYPTYAHPRLYTEGSMVHLMSGTYGRSTTLGLVNLTTYLLINTGGIPADLAPAEIEKNLCEVRCGAKIASGSLAVSPNGAISFQSPLTGTLVINSSTSFVSIHHMAWLMKNVG